MDQQNPQQYQHQSYRYQQNQQSHRHQQNIHHTYHHQIHHQYPHQEPEKVLRVVKQSRRAILGNYAVIAALFYFGFFSLSIVARNNVLSQFGWFFLAFAAVTLIYSEIKIHYKKLIITNKRAILNEGILKKNHITIRYSSITEVLSKQRVYQRLLNYGNIMIRTSGIKREQDLQIDYVPNPGYVKDMIEHFMIGEHKI